MNEVKKFQISRREWLRGEGGSVSSLLRPEDGKRCCIGIYGRALGLSDEQMTNVLYPSSCSLVGLYPDWVTAPAGAGLAVVNDSSVIGDKEREQLIADKFAANGVEVEFIP